MEETTKPLDRETLERLVQEWDRKSSQKGLFALTAQVWPKADGTQRDAIHIEEEGEETEVILIMPSVRPENPFSYEEFDPFA